MNTKEAAAKLPWLNSTNLASTAVLIALAVLLSVISPAFRDPQNLINILQQVTVNAILALGVTIVTFTGGTDLSIGSVVTPSGVVTGTLVIDLGANPWLAAFIGIVLGSVCSTINGLLISRFRLQPMIATLDVMSIARGAALTLAGGHTISGYPSRFTWLGNGTIPGTTIPVQIVFMLLLYVIAYYFMRYRHFGRTLYSIGGNEEVTRLSGINVFRYKTLAYTVPDALAGITSVVLVAKLNSTQSITGQNYELDAIASAVIGDTSLLSDRGSIWGTLMGALIIGVIRNGLNLLNVSSYLQKPIIGFIILIAVLVDVFRNRERSWRPDPTSRKGRRKMRKSVTFLLAVVVLAAVGCAGSSKSEDGVTRIAYVVKAMTDKFWIDMKKGAEEYTVTNDIELGFQSPKEETDVERQIQMVENALMSKAGVIILPAVNSQALIPTIVRANETRVPMILVDDTIEPKALETYGGHTATYIGIDQYAAAKLAGEDAVARHPEGGNVVLLERVASVNALQRRLDGFKDQVAANLKSKVIASQTANNDRHQAFNMMQNIPQSNLDVGVVWTINAEMGQGAVQAIQQSGTTRRVAVYDFGASSGDIATIRAGTLVGSVAQYPKFQAEGAINVAFDAMAGKNLPTHTMTKAELITAANMDILKQQLVRRSRGASRSSAGGRESSRPPGTSGRGLMAAKRPTLVDLAEASRFSIALVSIVMRGAPGTSAETRQRVKEVANRIGHQPNQLTRRLRCNNSGLPGVSLTVSHPFHADLVRRLYRASFGEDVDLVLSTHLPGCSEERAAATLLDKRYGVVILLGPTMPVEEVTTLARDVPAVVVAHRLGGISGVDVVCPDDCADAAMAVDHLASLGHRQITHVDDSTQVGAPGRRAGYCEAMAGRGLDSETRVVPGGTEELDGYTAMMALFDSGPVPTDILAFNDECAVGVLSAAVVLGCRIPEGLSVMGYDGSHRAVTTRIPLTSLAQTYEALTVATIDWAITQARERSEALEIVTQPELVIRESTGWTPDSPRGS